VDVVEFLAGETKTNGGFNDEEIKDFE